MAALDIINYIKTIISFFVIVFDIVLIIPIFKVKHNNSHVKALYIQFLFSSILFSFSSAINGLYQLQIPTDCYLFNILATFSGTPMAISLLSITLHSFFILTNNYFFHKKKQMILLILIILTWLPSIGLLILFFKFSNLMDQNCIVDSQSYSYYMTIPRTIIEISITVICIILLIKVCRLKVSNDKELQISKIKTLSKITSYIIAIIIGIVLKYLAFISGIPMLPRNLFMLSLPIYFIILNFVFLWNKQFQDAFINIYCCKKQEKTENTIMNNSQKELIVQQDFEEGDNSYLNEEQE